LTTRRELTAAIRQRYEAADRNSKKMILDEFVKVTGYHRKHAIRVLTTFVETQRERAVGHRVYQEAVKKSLIVLWEASDRICGKRLKALLPLLVEAMERHGHLQLDDGVKKQVLAMSAATIDRQLRAIREQASGGRKKRTARFNRVGKMVPVRTFADWGEVSPGYLEMDLVVHCGTRLVGSFVHTLVLIDVASGWTECLALPVREQTLIVEAITGLRPRLPFPLLGLDTDNDSAFFERHAVGLLPGARRRLHTQPCLSQERPGLGRAEEWGDCSQADWLWPTGGPECDGGFASPLRGLPPLHKLLSAVLQTEVQVARRSASPQEILPSGNAIPAVAPARRCFQRDEAGLEAADGTTRSRAAVEIHSRGTGDADGVEPGHNTSGGAARRSCLRQEPGNIMAHR